ncbi:MAG TPA: hypothetical protein VGZ68_07130 [Acidimicrobiales bacterium]|jgi:hypothetical protein|nr:hypothetical protein [Acidimicrobiales bacterium]
MATMTIVSRPPENEGMAPLPWRRMAWVTWRQHRAALFGVGAFLGLVSLYLVISGLHLHHVYSAAVACRPAVSLTCNDLVSSFNSSGDFLSSGLVLQVVPVLIGAFVGAPLLAREMETGTFRFAFTQGFGRGRFALAKLVSLAVAVTAAAGVFSVLTSWYYQPYFLAVNERLGLSETTPFAPGLFDLREVTLAAWTLVAFAIGALAGMLIRRVVPAIVATLVAYAGLAIAAGSVFRAHYLAPLVTRKLNVTALDWTLNQRWTTRGGRSVSQSVISQVLQAGDPQLAGKGGVPQSLSVWRYLVGHGYTQWTTYQPTSRFWPFQLIEGSWLLALSVILIAVTVWLVRGRLT